MGPRLVLSFPLQKNTVEDDLLGQEEQDLDYLAPFLIQIGPREKMPKGQALRVRDDCLTDLKHCLVDKVNIIQARFEKVFPASLQDMCVTGVSSALAGGYHTSHWKQTSFHYLERHKHVCIFFGH